jgi:hypothetical protein
VSSSPGGFSRGLPCSFVRGHVGPWTLLGRLGVGDITLAMMSAANSNSSPRRSHSTPANPFWLCCSPLLRLKLQRLVLNVLDRLAAALEVGVGGALHRSKFSWSPRSPSCSSSPSTSGASCSRLSCSWRVGSRGRCRPSASSAPRAWRCQLPPMCRVPVTRQKHASKASASQDVDQGSGKSQFTKISDDRKRIPLADRLTRLSGSGRFGASSSSMGSIWGKSGPPNFPIPANAYRSEG